MLKALSDGFRHYADFRGRTTRALFWNFIVATHLLIILLMLPAIVEFMKFWRFAMEDVRMLNAILAVYHSTTAAADTIVAVLAELAGEYFAAGLPKPAVYGAIASSVLALICLLPTLSITVRRLRDAGYSIWWILPPVLSFIPLPLLTSLAQILSLVTLVLCCMPTRKELPEVPTI